MAYQQYYSAPLDRLISGDEVRRSTGITPDLSATGNIRGLNAAQVYPLTRTENPYDIGLYTVTVSYVTANYPSGAPIYDGTTGPAGEYATQSYSETARPLDTAKANGKQSERTRASENTAAIARTSGYTVDALTSAAAQLAADRGTDVGNTIALQESVMDQLDTNLTAIDAATDVATIAAVVDAPDLVMNTGRGLAGEFDMNPSHFPTINMGSVLESDLELYIPAADTILPYRTNLPAPYHFDMGAPLFTAGDQRIVVRIAATGAELGTLTCPDTGTGANVDVDIYTAQS